MLLTGLLFIICCNVAFAGVLGGVMGIVCTVVFAVLSSFMNFIWYGILGMATCGSNSYFVCFFFQDNNVLLLALLVLDL